MSDNAELIARARKAAKVIYIAVEQEVADDVGSTLLQLCAALESEQARIAELEDRDLRASGKLYFHEQAIEGIAAIFGLMPDDYDSEHDVAVRVRSEIESLRSQLAASERTARERERAAFKDGFIAARSVYTTARDLPDLLARRYPALPTPEQKEEG